MSQELEPTAPTEVEIPIKRRNTANAVSVPIKVVVNDGDVFNVSNADFAAGSEDAVVKVTFPNAVPGTAYSLEMTVEGADYVSSWSPDLIFTYTVQRVKWNNLGNCLFADWFFFDDYMEREIHQRDDVPNLYRIIDPYFGGINTDRGSEILFIQVCKKGDKVLGQSIPASGMGYWYSSDSKYYANTGYFHGSYEADILACFPGRFTNYQAPSNWEYSRVKYFDENGNPGLIQLAPYYYMDGIGGWNYFQGEPEAGDGGIEIIMPGFEVPDEPEEPEAYVADIKKDFEWEQVYTGAYSSAMTGNVSDVTLVKGTCVTTTDDCDKVFAETYGTAYALVNPYGANAVIYFGVKEDGAITLPVAGPQATGLKALSEDVYVTINPKKSSFSEKLITLNMTFQNKKGDLVYGTTDETLSNITWNLVGTGTYTYSLFFEGEDPGLELYQREDMPELFKITNWAAGVDFVFNWNQSTNEVVVADQFIGYTHATHGDVWVMEAPEYNSALAGMESSYDPAIKTFNFGVIYYVSAGYFGYGYETFELDDAPAAISAKSLTKSPINYLKTNVKRESKFIGKPYDRKAIVATGVEKIF